MVRGAAKEQAQQRNAAKLAAQKGGSSQLGTRAAAFKFNCPTCKTPLTSYKTLKIHYDSKHPKETLADESTFAA